MCTSNSYRVPYPRIPSSIKQLRLSIPTTPSMPHYNRHSTINASAKFEFITYICQLPVYLFYLLILLCRVGYKTNYTKKTEYVYSASDMLPSSSITTFIEILSKSDVFSPQAVATRTVDINSVHNFVLFFIIFLFSAFFFCYKSYGISIIFLITCLFKYGSLHSMIPMILPKIGRKNATKKAGRLLVASALPS